MLYIFLLLAAVSITSVEKLRAEESISIGNYTAGCIKNSHMLPVDGPGYQVIRTSRNSHYGHKNLIDLIENMASEIKSTYGVTLLIGDLSNKSGGPMPEYHNSHQIGLDADVLYIHKYAKKDKRLYSINEREKMSPRSVLNESRTAIDHNKWNWINGKVLKLTASHVNVDRIFVNPLIKKELCSIYDNQAWLRKIRPWDKHDGHFHLRLKCPDNSIKCIPGPSIPKGTGCGKKLEIWFSQKKRKTNSKKKPKRTLPEECEKIL